MHGRWLMIVGLLALCALAYGDGPALRVLAYRETQAAVPPVPVWVEAHVPPDARNRLMTLWVECDGQTAAGPSSVTMDGAESGPVFGRSFMVRESGWCEGWAEVTRVNGATIRAMSARFLIGGADAE